ncbi:MAG: hypothetical protein IIW08_02670, partial [Clostridia bacterium]|nr:hypothetical protein [Clostridia bacterium]
MMNDQAEQRFRTILLLFAAVISLAILIVVSCTENCDALPSGRGQYITLDEWTIVNDTTGEVKNITMPYTLEFDGDESFYS